MLFISGKTNWAGRTWRGAGEHNTCISEDAGPKVGGLTRVWNVPTPPTLPFSSFGLLSGQSNHHYRKLGAKEFSKIQILACRRDPDPLPAGALALAFEPRVP